MHGTKTFTFAGGILGLFTYLIVGLLPSIVYGGFAGVSLAAGILGSPIDESILAKGIVLFSMVVGVLSTAGLFTVSGAALGAGVYSLANKLPKSARVPRGATK